MVVRLYTDTNRAREVSWSNNEITLNGFVKALRLIQRLPACRYPKSAACPTILKALALYGE